MSGSMPFTSERKCEPCPKTLAGSRSHAAQPRSGVDLSPTEGWRITALRCAVLLMAVVSADTDLS